MAQTPQQYFTELFREAGYDDATIGTVLPHFTNEKVSGKLGGLLKTAQDDYNAQVGRVRAAEQRVQQYDNWYGTESKKYNDMVAELATAKAALNGGGNGYQEPPQFDTSKFISKDDLAQFARDQGQRYATVIKEATRIGADHVARFGEAPDMNAIERIATESNLSLSQAYDQYVKPRVEQKDGERIQREKEEYANQKVKDALSRHRLPVDAVPQESAPINRYAKTGADRSGIASDAELMEVWNSAAGGGQK